MPSEELKVEENMKTFKLITTIISLTIVCILLTGIVYMGYMMGQYARMLDNVNDHETDVLEDVLEAIPEEDYVPEGEVPDVVLPPYNDVARDDEVINILLIGDDEINFRGRSDTMLIATIDTRNRQLKLTSLLRDTWVHVPGTDKNGRQIGSRRMNVAYALGDANLLMQTIRHNFGIDIDWFVVVNFNMFREIIDNNLGGLDLNLSDAEVRYLRNRREAGPGGNLRGAGINRLTGRQALEFSRLRNLNFVTPEGSTLHSDFGRAARQRFVLQSIFNQARGQNLQTLIGVVNTAMRNMRTDMPAPVAAQLVTTALDFGINNIHQLQIPYPGSFESTTVQGTSHVLFMSEANLRRNRERIQNFIFERQ
jgi:LCP family protein required for cell wall assembly